MSDAAERHELERLVRGWLLNRPRAVSLRLQVGDEVRTVAIPKNATWATVAGTVVRMRPDQIEALDEHGAVLRATDLHDLAGVDDDVQVAGAARTTPAPPMPPGVEALAVPPDPESQRFALVAQLLAGAYRHSTDVAFERLSQILERGEQRAASLERTVDTMYRLERQRLERFHRELDEREEEIEEAADKKGEGAVDKLVEHFAKSFADDDDAGAGAGDDEQPQPNGKAH